MYLLGEGLGVTSEVDIDSLVKFISVLDLHIDNDGFVYYNDMLYAVLKQKYTRKLVSLKPKSLEKQIIRH